MVKAYLRPQPRHKTKQALLKLHLCGCYPIAPMPRGYPSSVFTYM